MNYYPEIIPPDTQTVLDAIKHITVKNGFYLSGGTALALQIGHRESEDLDFFNMSSFSPESLQKDLLLLGSLTDVVLAEGTLNLFVGKVKLQFLYYPYRLLQETRDWNGINLSSMLDIACTKLITVGARGSKKDFIDMYFILQKMELKSLLGRVDEEYQGVNYNYPHILKSLVYFEDANNEPMPKMHKIVNWEVVKESLIKEVKKIEF